ncbi:MAG: hypothetical protein KJ646_01060 [Nanoarchaeota archaeon]|nr:hypothetical protein [Nanoarchaeota archaeon]MBU4116198.1 hypothetical protein [Nanoarchaeota archaeon]
MNHIKKGRNKKVAEILQNRDAEEKVIIAKIQAERKNNPGIIGQIINREKMSPKYVQDIIFLAGGISNEEIIAAIKPMGFDESKKFLKNLPYKQRDKFTSEYFNRLNHKNYEK